MATSLNRIQLIGNLGRDAEIKTTANGTTVCILSLATNDSWQDKQTQEWIQETEWHRVVFYGRAADNLAALHLRKGESMYVDGKLKTRKWTDKQGVERTIVEVNGDTYVPHRERGNNGQQQGAPQRPAQNQNSQPQQNRQQQYQQQAAPHQQQQQQQRQNHQQQRPQQHQQPQQSQDNWDDDLPF